MATSLVPLFPGLPAGPELLIVLAIIVLLFGANKLPKLARSSGQALGEFKKGREEIEEELQDMRGDPVGENDSQEQSQFSQNQPQETQQAQQTQDQSQFSQDQQSQSDQSDTSGWGSPAADRDRETNQR